jgi:hypothetical protein
MILGCAGCAGESSYFQWSRAVISTCSGKDPEAGADKTGLWTAHMILANGLQMVSVPEEAEREGETHTDRDRQTTC